MKSFTDMDIWDVGLELVEEVYAIARLLPHDELYGLASQMKRASTSILANLAEGFSRRTDADKSHKYIISRGECSEVKALILIAVRLKFISMGRTNKAMELIEREGQLLSGLLRSYSS